MKNSFITSTSGKTTKYETTRTGKTNRLIDSKRNALLSGKRISKAGNIYYEKRKNRSDLLNEKV
jgi:hypothetical protein